ncbi:ExbD/TolR family protein [Verrucomicrobiota bacterium]
MHLSTGYENRKARIEIVPLIDVVFLLLVFFIYAMLSMTVYRGLRVDLPHGSGIHEELRTLVITISEDNTLWIEDHPSTMNEAIAIAADRVTQHDGPVLVSGDRNADLGIAIELLSGLRRVNVKSVSFQVKGEGNEHESSE